MIISTVIMAASFMLIVYELLSALMVFRLCRNVRCTVLSSEKVSVREDGFLLNEHWKTEIGFELAGAQRTAMLETSTFCQKGQVMNCYYYPRKDLVFRKRDIRRVFRAHSIPAFSVGVLFLALDIIFGMTSLGGIIMHHLIEALAVILVATFAVFGIWFIVYFVNALRHTNKSKAVSVKADIIDVVRKTKRHRENERYFYYPIYRYKLDGFEHTVRSKIMRETPPKKGQKETVLADKRRGGLIEYQDIYSSLALGICFIAISSLIAYCVFIM